MSGATKEMAGQGASSQTILLVDAVMSKDANVSTELRQAVLGILSGTSQIGQVTPPDELLDEKAVQVMLKLSHQTLWRLRRAGELVPIPIGRCRRYSRQVVADFIRRQAQRRDAAAA